MHNVSLKILITTVIVSLLSVVALTQNFNNEQEKMRINNNLTEDANNINITVVYDNNVYKEGLETAWGFACVITGTEKTILFDTGGNGKLLLENMSKTGIDTAGIEIVVLSHIHGDHTDGLENFLQKNPNVSVYLPESFPKQFKEMITSYNAKIVEVNKHTKICKGVYLTGQMGTSIKEQGLIIKTEKGLVVITGCAHPGIVKMVKKAKDLFDEKILLVMGGFHLGWANESQIETIIKSLKDMDVKYAGPCHCTGNKARSIFAEHFKDTYINIGVGRVLKIKGSSVN